MNDGATPFAKNLMLDPFAGKLCMLALYSGQDEIVDAMYQRKEVQTSLPMGEGDVRFVENTETVRFEGFNSAHLVDRWVLFDMNGEMLFRWRVDEPIEVSPKMDCKFRPGELRIGLP